MHHILINVGVNDTDRKNGKDVFNEMENIITLIKSKWPNVKIILCELTPRNDSNDIHVLECNKLLQTYSINDENIFLADHSNLRENSYSRLKDRKHVSKPKIGDFVINIKKALCAAYGKQYIGRISSDNRTDDNNIINQDSVTDRLMNFANYNNSSPQYMESNNYSKNQQFSAHKNYFMPNIVSTLV